MGAVVSVVSRLRSQVLPVEPEGQPTKSVREAGDADGVADEDEEQRRRRESMQMRLALMEFDANPLRVDARSPRLSTTINGLRSMEEFTTMRLLNEESQVAVYKAMYDLSQVTDGTGQLPEHFAPRFEFRVCELVGADISYLYVYDEPRAELHCEISAEEEARWGVSTCVPLGEGEVGTVALRVAQGESYVSQRWSPQGGAHAISLPMRTLSGRLVGVVSAVRTHAGAREFGTREEARLRALCDGSAALVQQTLNHREAVVGRYQAELLLALHAADPSAEGLDQAILEMIVILIKMLSADKVSIFIADDVRQEFWIRTSETASMGGAKGVTFPYGKGIVGHVYTTKKAANLPDAYLCPHFSDRFDLETGYRTKQVLAVPMMDAEGRVIAVIQALNKHRGNDVFTVQDERVLTGCCEKIARTMHQKLGRATFRELLHDKNLTTEAFRIISGTDVARPPTPAHMGGGEVMNSLHSPVRVLLDDLTLETPAWDMAKDDLTFRIAHMLIEMNLCTVLVVHPGKV